ncbi:MAG: hypothetical protein PHD04_03645 [Candidatus Pacebacteria bacterium]|nr:hypothetical protein [Candidatus Paceibacterota bacterium]
MKVLQTQTIRGIESTLTKNDDEFVIRFNSKRARDAFARWLVALQADAKRSPVERFDAVRKRMDASSQDQGAGE